MLAEALEHLLTPCPAPARKLGLLRESVAIGARHRRCRAAWRPHLERCRARILEVAGACQGRDTALILGSGRLLDIPLDELAARFRRVVLADAVQPLSVRWRARPLPGVRLDSVDLTGTWPDVLQGRLPRPALPARYREISPDLTVSANCLSQLPLAPLQHLEALERFEAGELEAFRRAVLAAHVDWLRALPGVRLLLTDTAWPPGPRGEDPLPGLALPAPLDAWDWPVAPRPEIHADRDVVHRVGAFLLRG